MNKEKRIERLYAELCDLKDETLSPLSWIGYLKEPHFYQFKKKKHHKKIKNVFYSYGFFLTEEVADLFFRAPSQQTYEDVGGALIRKLKMGLKYQR